MLLLYKLAGRVCLMTVQPSSSGGSISVSFEFRSIIVVAVPVAPAVPPISIPIPVPDPVAVVDDSSHDVLGDDNIPIVIVP